MRPGLARRSVRVRPGRLAPRTASSVAFLVRLAGRALRAKVDQHARDAGVLQLFQGGLRELGRQFDVREVRSDGDVAEIAAVQAALVGDGADDGARADPVPL